VQAAAAHVPYNDGHAQKQSSGPEEAEPQVCQKKGQTLTAMEAPVSFHRPSLLQAMTWKRYLPAGTWL